MDRADARVRTAVEGGATELYVVGDAKAVRAVHRETVGFLQKNGFATLLEGERLGCPRLPDKFAVFARRPPPLACREGSSARVIYAAEGAAGPRGAE